MPEGITLKRIIDMDEAAELTSSDYALVDSATGGPKKFALGDELSSLKNDLDTNEKYKNALVSETATGSIASFTDGADGVPMDSVVVAIEPVQDLNGQDAPYPAGGGVNQWDEQWELGNYNTSTGDKGTATDQIRCKNKIPVTPNTSFYFNFSSGAMNAVVFYDENEQYLGSDTAFGISSAQARTTPSGAYYMAFQMSPAYGTTYNNDISINYPSTDHDYHPYSNICPISGWTQVQTDVTGVNVWDEEWESGSIDTITGEKQSNSSVIRSSNYIPCSGNTAYCFNLPWAHIFYYDADKNFITYIGNSVTEDGAIHAKVMTTPENACYMLFRCSGTYGTTYNNDISINYPATNTSYIAHDANASTHTTALGQTVYGATLDVVSGVLTIDKKYVDLSTITFSNNGTYYYSSSILADAEDPNHYDYNGVTPIISDTYMSDTPNHVVHATTNNTIAYYTSALGGLMIVSNSTPTGHIVYPLATPTTVQLTAQEVDSLLGDNNVFSDAGDVTVTYVADTKLYIQKVLNA